MDTALAILMRDACDLVGRDVLDLMEAVRERAFRHKHAPMIGRTHGVHAEPMTFDLKMALWHAELQRQLERLDRARATIAVIGPRRNCRISPPQPILSISATFSATVVGDPQISACSGMERARTNG